VAFDVALPAAPAERPLARALTARVGLSLIVGASFLARAVAAAAHPVPRYFPDEYLYTAMARALAAGHAPSVRGQAAHFPALLAPLLAAPWQALAGPEGAYRLTQLENALLMSLAAVPVYLLARRLALAKGWALACAAFAVLVPDLVFAGYTLADPVAYPFVLGAVYAGVVAVETASRRSQLSFLLLAALAAFARVQYVVLPLAYLVAAAAVDRRRVVRTQRLPLVLYGLGAAGAAALGAHRILGYYSHVSRFHVGGSVLRWMAVDLFLLGLAAGVVLVPGAVVALARPRGRCESGFAALTAVFGGGLLVEAALYAANGSDRFQERYLFSLLPLVPVAFGLYLKHGRPARLPVAALALTLLVLSARVPLSGYAAAAGKTDSPFLTAVFRLEHALGTANGALVVAALAALGALAAIAVSRRGGGGAAIAATLAFAAVASAGAVASDVSNARDVRDTYLPRNPSWVDAAHVGPVTLVQTVGSPPDRAIEQLYWNRSVTREVRLGDALPTDVYAAPKLRVSRDGTLPGVGAALLFQGYAAAVRFQNATLRAAAGSFSLWTADGAPRLSLLEQGRYFDGWLARSGRLSLWPDASGRTAGRLRFTLSLPPNGRPVSVRFGKMSYRVLPGRATAVTYTIDTRGPWSLAFSARRGRWLADLRAVSVRSTLPTFERFDAPQARATLAA